MRMHRIASSAKRTDRRCHSGPFPRHFFPACCDVAGRNPFQFNVANEVWSLGAAGTQVLLNGGLTSA
jgi:hypothetical protein